MSFLSDLATHLGNATKEFARDSGIPVEWVHRFATQMFSHPENQAVADPRRWYVNQAGKMIKGDSPHGAVTWSALEDKSGGTLHDQFGDHVLKAPPGAKPGGHVAKWAQFQSFPEPSIESSVPGSAPRYNPNRLFMDTAPTLRGLFGDAYMKLLPGDDFNSLNVPKGRITDLPEETD